MIHHWHLFSAYREADEFFLLKFNKGRYKGTVARLHLPKHTKLDRTAGAAVVQTGFGIETKIPLADIRSSCVISYDDKVTELKLVHRGKDELEGSDSLGNTVLKDDYCIFSAGASTISNAKFKFGKVKSITPAGGIRITNIKTDKIETIGARNKGTVIKILISEEEIDKMKLLNYNLEGIPWDLEYRIR